MQSDNNTAPFTTATAQVVPAQCCPHCGKTLHVVSAAEARKMLYESLRVAVSRATIYRYCVISPLPVVQADQDKKVAVARWYREILAHPRWKRKSIARDSLGNEVSMN